MDMIMLMPVFRKMMAAFSLASTNSTPTHIVRQKPLECFGVESRLVIGGGCGVLQGEVSTASTWNCLLVTFSSSGDMVRYGGFSPTKLILRLPCRPRI